MHWYIPIDLQQAAAAGAAPGAAHLQHATMAKDALLEDGPQQYPQVIEPLYYVLHSIE
jgi:hypothetical protein